MRFAWMAALGLALATTSAGAAEQQKDHSKMSAAEHAEAMRPFEATKHLAVMNAGLEDAKTNAEMLAEIAKNEASYDTAHARLFATNIDEALLQADGHFAHLKPLAKTEDEKRQVELLGKRLQAARDMAKPLNANLEDRAKVQKDAEALEKKLEENMQPLENVVKLMDAKVDVG